MTRPPRRTAVSVAAAVGLALLAAFACRPASDGPSFERTRGYVLISLDSVGAARLGSDRGSSGRDEELFLDRLAREGALFERAISQSPSTLVSHVSMFTGLYPRQHDVSPPSLAVSDRLSMLPEVFSNFGFRTAGHTEGGFVARHYGFHRGFDEFSDPLSRGDADVEATFGRGLDFLRRLDPGERFFLFLQTSSASHPYEPPSGAASDGLADREDPGSIDSTGATLRAANRGFRDVTPSTAAVFERRYEAGLSYLDGVIESFFAELERLGLRDETTIVVTAAHGVEFLEHGGLGHTQAYPETLHVPLVLLHPSIHGPVRVAELVELVDLAPTLYDLARLPPPEPTSGRSLAPLVAGERRERTRAFGETGKDRSQRTLLRRQDGKTHQFVSTRLPAERDGTWVTRRAGFEETRPSLDFSLVSFQRPREVRILLEGEEVRAVQVGTGWTPVSLDLPPDRERYRLELTADDCESPLQLGLSDDPRCLSFKVRGVDLVLGELFDLDDDPLAARDLGSSLPELHRELATELAGLGWSTLAAPQKRPLNEDTYEALRALGWVD